MPDDCVAGHLGTIPVGEVATRFRCVRSLSTAKQNSWISEDTDEGRDYCYMLQVICASTRANHSTRQQAVVVCGRDASHVLCFAPQGAGRNYSRTKKRRRMGALTSDQMLAAETAWQDLRLHAGQDDASEQPSSYKRAEAVIEQIGEYGPADVVVALTRSAAPWRERSRRFD